VLSIRAGANLALENQIVTAQGFEHGFDIRLIDPVDPQCWNQPRAFLFQVLEIGFVAVPPHQASGIVEPRNRFDLVQGRQKRVGMVPIIPCGSDDRSAIVSPVLAGIGPIDIDQLQAFVRKWPSAVRSSSDRVRTRLSGEVEIRAWSLWRQGKQFWSCKAHSWPLWLRLAPTSGKGARMLFVRDIQ